MKTIITTIMILLISLTGLSTNYYVNDNSTTGDIYCTAVGASGNTGTTSSPFLKLSSAISVASSGDFIYVDAGTYIESDRNINVTLAGLSIIGAGMKATIFDNNNRDHNFIRLNANNITLQDIYIREYSKSGSLYAPAINITEGAYTGINITRVQVDNNGATNSLYPIEVGANASVTFTGGAGSCNDGWILSGGVRIYGASTVVNFSNYSFIGNQRNEHGAGLRVESGTVKIYNSIFVNNITDSDKYGSAIYISGGTVSIYDSKIDANTTELAGANASGGSIRVSGGTFRITRSTITNHNQVGSSTSYGAGIGVTGGSVTIDSCAFSGNIGSTTRGTDIYNDGGTVLVRYCTLGSSSKQLGNRSGSLTYSNTGNPSVYNGGGTITFTNTTVSSYTPIPIVPTYTGTCATAVVLPIELLYFKGDPHVVYNKLYWETASEHNNDYFTIEKTRDGTYFYNIAVIKGAGNSNQRLYYQYLDRDVEDGINYYILKQTDYDGKFKYSDIISIDNRKESSPTLIKVTNTLGQEVKGELKGFLIFHYSDGTTIKRIF